MLTRLFGAFGVLLAFSYLIEGLSWGRYVLNTLFRLQFGMFGIQLIIIAADYLFGVALLTAAIGLLLAQDWAKKMWLIVTFLLVLTHGAVILISEIVSNGVSQAYWVWTAMVIAVTALSWWYLGESPATQEAPPPPQDLL